MFGKSKAVTRTYCGKNVSEMCKVRDLLCTINDTTVLEPEELEAMEIAIQSISDHINDMKTEKKWEYV